MYMLRIEHPVRDYDEWKKAFDSDPGVHTLHDDRASRDERIVRVFQAIRGVRSGEQPPP